MKTLFACAIAVAVTTAASGWPDPAAADEPFELTNAQLDRVAGGTEIMALEITAIDGTFSLDLRNPGTTVDVQHRAALQDISITKVAHRATPH